MTTVQKHCSEIVRY